MPRMNRVDPFGDLTAVSERGTLTGNRGCLVDEHGAVTRHHRSNAWITCLLTFRSNTHPLDRPGTWTPLFFLDEAVALAAGHRPCGYCRRNDHRDFLDAARDVVGERLSTAQLDRILAAERLRPGRGLRRAGDRITTAGPLDGLPTGTVVIVGSAPHLVTGGGVQPFSFSGWGTPRPGPAVVEILTPPTTVAALRAGYVPRLDVSASGSERSQRHPER
jgi:hypothetical protein